MPAVCVWGAGGVRFFKMYSFLTGELDLPRLTPGATSCRVQPNDPACIANMSDNGRNACAVVNTGLIIGNLIGSFVAAVGRQCC